MSIKAKIKNPNKKTRAMTAYIKLLNIISKSGLQILYKGVALNSSSNTGYVISTS